MKVKEIMKNPWFIGIVLILLGSVLTPITTVVINKITYWSAIKLIFSNVWSAFIHGVSYKVSIWGILVSIVLIFVAILLLAYVSAKRGRVSSKPDFLIYKKDKIKNGLFEWEYYWNSFDKEYKIENLQQICGKCECQLIKTSFGSVKCPNCENTEVYISRNDYDAIGKIIIHKVKTGEYKATKYFKEQ